ncbi:MAG: helix-turn-helix transcriptional regulator [Acidobacteria bacterium]|nr:helix-turn-helix transcriptional regulator [Acidobacteriota bacterium]
MNTFNSIWRKLRRSKRYREEFVADHVKRAVPYQARALMKANKLNQQELAKRSKLSQGVISRAVDPSYGNLTLSTIIRLAAGFDLAYVGRFVPFSELARWYADLPDESWKIPSFEEEDAEIATDAQPCAAVAPPVTPIISATVRMDATYGSDATRLKKSVGRENDNFSVVMSEAYGPSQGNEVRA